MDSSGVAPQICCGLCTDFLLQCQQIIDLFIHLKCFQTSEHRDEETIKEIRVIIGIITEKVAPFSNMVLYTALIKL